MEITFTMISYQQPVRFSQWVLTAIQIIFIIVTCSKCFHLTFIDSNYCDALLDNSLKLQ